MFAAGPVTTSVTVQVIEPVLVPVTGLRGGGGGGPWNPAQLGTSLALWLDADDSSTITLNGINVAQWDDKSGNDRHATQPSAALQPVLSGSDVVFDGTELMELPQNIASLNSVGAVFVGRYAANTGSQNYILFANGAGTDERFYAGAADASFADFVWNVETSSPFTTVTADTNKHIFGLTHSSDVADAFLDASNVGTTARTKTDLIDNWFLGGVNSATPRLDGVINETIVLSAAISTEDRQKLEGYLAWKWGLEENLPIDHPYRFDGRLFGYGAVSPFVPLGSDFLITSDGDVFIVQ